MIKGKWIVLILIVLILLFNGVRYFSNYQAKQAVKNDTVMYLENNGYEKSDIDDIEAVNVGGNDLKYGAVITFMDEKSVDYLYTYKSSSEQIIQMDALNEGEEGELKHLE